MAHGQLACVVLRLPDALGQCLIPRLGLDDGQLGVAVFQHVVGYERSPAPARPLDPAGCNPVLAPNSASLDHAPACRRKGRIDVFGSGFGLVHD